MVVYNGGAFSKGPILFIFAVKIWPHLELKLQNVHIDIVTHVLDI